MTAEKNYNGIDLVKFFCAFLVFIIHASPFAGPLAISGIPYAGYLDFGFGYCLTKIAVPYFFVCSGFFLFGKMQLHELNINAIRAYCFKILRLLGLWLILLACSSSNHLWYMKGLVVAVMIVSLCLYLRIKMLYIYLLALLCYFIGMLGDTYYGFIAPYTVSGPLMYLQDLYLSFFGTTRNGVFMGFIFVLMGADLAHREVKISSMGALLGFVLSMLVLCVEAYFLRYHSQPREYNMYLSLLPAIFFLFQFSRSLSLKDRPIYSDLRAIGQLVYFSHLLMVTVAIQANHLVNQLFGFNFFSYRVVVALLLTLSVSVIITRLSHRENFRWLRYLYS